jgi:hypothetical protein
MENTIALPVGTALFLLLLLLILLPISIGQILVSVPLVEWRRI